ncbi:MAG: aminopeptidase P family protein [Alphaproteobacteria bacterium]|nr:aminopeptidase P family protein [Alphaproteobacteria bacterium]
MTDKPDFAKRLSCLRREMKRLGIDGFLIPSADAFQGEYVPASDRRLAWISGFTGSMGQCVVLSAKAGLFVDGRYTLQAAQETDAKRFCLVPTQEKSLSDWLGENLKAGQVLGIDPWLVTANGSRLLEDACSKAGASLRLLDANPLDAIWKDRPAPPNSPVVAQDVRFAGEEQAAKRLRASRLLAQAKCDAALIASPESLCWLLNLRAADVPYAPLLRAFALLHADASVDLFLDQDRLKTSLGDGVRLHRQDSLISQLSALGRARKSISVDPAQTPLLLTDCLKFSGARIVHGPDPCLGLRAVKNPVEIAGARAAHRRDGAALVRFLANLKAGVRETQAAKAVDAERAKEDLAQGPSFGTIAAQGANGAIVHYRARPGRDAKLKPGNLFLLDSGGQYLDGTTDVTRTVFIGPGQPTADMKRLFTLVLKGHIALASAVFPKGTQGGQLDALARQFLWQEGLDYDHGTGHGVGSYLSVHEGPQRIAKSGSTAALEEGMILSIEPGYYRAGVLGIRIESLALVVAAKRSKKGERDMLAFEILTQAPIDKRLLAPGLLTKPERQWLNAYHLGIRRALGSGLEGKPRAWLERATTPL